MCRGHVHSTLPPSPTPHNLNFSKPYVDLLIKVIRLPTREICLSTSEAHVGDAVYAQTLLVTPSSPYQYLWVPQPLWIPSMRTAP